MVNTIQPLDIIRITQPVNAKLVVHYHAPFTDAIDIQITSETILISSVSNYGTIDEYLFLPNDGQDDGEILKSYKYDIPEGESLDCSFRVAATELSGKFEVIEQFDYNNLRPESGSHILLLARFYFDGNLQKVSTEKWSSFVLNFDPLKKIIGDYDDALITSNEAIDAISQEIQRQIFSSKNKDTESRSHKILGKIDLPPDSNKEV